MKALAVALVLAIILYGCTGTPTASPENTSAPATAINTTANAATEIIDCPMIFTNQTLAVDSRINITRQCGLPNPLGMQLQNNLSIAKTGLCACRPGSRIGEVVNHLYDCADIIVGKRVLADDGTIIGYECYSIHVNEIEPDGNKTTARNATGRGAPGTSTVTDYYTIISASCAVENQTACGYPA